MKRLDWVTWVSLAAVAAVCIAVAAPSLKHHELPTPKVFRSARTERSERSAPKRPDVVPERKPSMVPEQWKAGVPDETADVVDEPKKDLVPEQAKSRGYRVNSPSRSIELGKALNEISGLGMAKRGDSLWAVHDERGILYRISVLDGSVQQEIELGKRGDFEGVEQVGDQVYVLRSDGVLLVVNTSGEGEIEKLVLTRDVGLACDAEGLAYERAAKRLLIACKNEGWKSSSKEGKAYEVHAFDLESQKVKDKPAFVLHAKDLDEHGVKGKAFAPSGLAVHPKTGEIYVVSARGEMMVVLSAEGKVVRAERLDPDVHLQPEGIAFAEDGTMYIADEAHGRRAMLHIIER